MRIGIDLDNTIIHYRAAFRAAAASRGLPPAFAGLDKPQLRDAVLATADGDGEWQRLQAIAYGSGMHRARLFAGVRTFMSACRRQGAAVFIVSHKTEFSAHASDVNLRDAARAWMASRRFFDPAGLGLSQDHVFFESTRAEKISRVAQLQCDVFIDDLVEVFRDPAFPSHVRRVLLSRTTPRPSGDWVVCGSWKAVSHAVFAR